MYPISSTRNMLVLLLLACSLLCVACPGANRNNTAIETRVTVPPGQEAQAEATRIDESSMPGSIEPAALNYRVGEQIDFTYGESAEGAIVVLVRSEVDPRVWQPAQLLAESHYMPVAGDGGKGSLIATDDGSWRLLLFSDSEDASSIAATSAPITITEWPRGHNDATGEPPYLTIGAEVPAEIELKLGTAVVGYYELQEAYPSTAWIGLVPAAVENPMEMYGRELAVEIIPLSGKLMDQAMFTLSKPGRYVLRVYPSNQSGCEWSLESQPFTVVQ